MWSAEVLRQYQANVLVKGCPEVELSKGSLGFAWFLLTKSYVKDGGLSHVSQAQYFWSRMGRDGGFS